MSMKPDKKIGQNFAGKETWKRCKEGTAGNCHEFSKGMVTGNPTKAGLVEWQEQDQHGVSPVKWETLGEVGEQVDPSRSWLSSQFWGALIRFPTLESVLMMFNRKTSSKRKKVQKEKKKTLQERRRETGETKTLTVERKETWQGISEGLPPTSLSSVRAHELRADAWSNLFPVYFQLPVFLMSN